MQRKIIYGILLLVSILIMQSNAYAHTELVVGDVTISIGWLNEPPLIGEFNYVYFNFVKDDKPFIIEPSDLEVKIRYGGVTKDLELEPLEKLGEYGAPIIPTRLGSYVVIIKGTVDGKPVDAEFPIEDVEDKSRLNFPEETSNASELQAITTQLQSSINQLQLNIEQASKKAEESNKVAEDTLDAVKSLRNDFDKVYNFGMLGIGLGAAGVIMGIIAMIKKPKEY
ncbi:MAG: hypothetical protein D6752_01385 [Candidatus Nitrosothermus koennekii]|nr:MAG: hypothetical protein D6752_01385 [Candidatus Nitrosothermus koennekii]